VTDKKPDKKKLASKSVRPENSGNTPSLRTLRRDLAAGGYDLPMFITRPTRH
jgi:hypothetical protein